jgi:hypothetical protein
MVCSAVFQKTRSLPEHEVSLSLLKTSVCFQAWGFSLCLKKKTQDVILKYSCSSKTQSGSPNEDWPVPKMTLYDTDGSLLKSWESPTYERFVRGFEKCLVRLLCLLRALEN